MNNYCRNCGKKLDTNENVCSNCKTVVFEQRITNPSEKLVEIKKEKEEEKKYFIWTISMFLIPYLLSSVSGLFFNEKTGNIIFSIYRICPMIGIVLLISATNKFKNSIKFNILSKIVFIFIILGIVLSCYLLITCTNIFRGCD